MKRQAFLPLFLAAATLALGGCAATPKPEPESKWVSATDAEVANLELEVQRAAKEYTQVTKDGVLLFCKKVRPSGSKISTTECLTESELRLQVQNTAKFRDDLRQSGGRCSGSSNCNNAGTPGSSAN